MCNRTCPTCIRNSNPNKEATKSWFEPHLMPMEVIEDIFKQYVKMRCRSIVCLCNYNEPLMDPRIVDITRLAKICGISYIYFCTNGDFLTPEIAKDLDGVLDRITVSLYSPKTSHEERSKYIKSLFEKTSVWINTRHRMTHFQPNVEFLNNLPCKFQIGPIRLVINHKGQYCLCCDDLNGIFDLGTFPETSLSDYWFGSRHMTIMNNLREIGGRNKYAYCSTCPRVW